MPSSRRRRKTVRRTHVSTQTVLKVAGFTGSGSMRALGARVYEAALVVASAAKQDAAGYPSRQIPRSIHVGQGSETSASVIADSPNAYPVETGARHPLFGNRGFWYPMRQRRFLENGAVDAGEEAALILAKVIDDWANELGYR